MAKLFGQRPSDIALLDDCIGEISRFWFDRGIAAFGNGVAAALEKAAQSSNPTIAATQRQREWERLMGGDMETSTTGFRDVHDPLSAHGRVVGADGDEETALEDGDWDLY